MAMDAFQRWSNQNNEETWSFGLADKKEAKRRTRKLDLYIGWTNNMPIKRTYKEI